MNIVDFDKLEPKTMTTLAFFQESVNIDLLYPLLPITPMINTIQVRVSNKMKAPLCKIAGSIISVRYHGHQRGIFHKKKSFKNGITIDIATQKKNVSAKIFKTKIHLCGITSIEMAEEASNYIVQHINKVQEDLDYLSQHEEETKNVMSWLRNLKMGDPVIVVYNNTNVNRGHKIDIPTIIPKELDTKIVNILTKNIREFVLYEDFLTVTEWILTKKNVISEPLRIECIEKAMVNYNYELHFTIDPWALKQNIDGKKGFNARYENAIDRSVKIQLPYEQLHTKLIRRKDRPTCHTFMVYKSGKVTQSGPNQELMKEVYYLFLQTISEIKPLIIDNTNPNSYCEEVDEADEVELLE